MYRPIVVTVIATTTTAAPKAKSLRADNREPSLFARLRRLFAVRRQRRSLAKLDATQLFDIGVSYEQARKEARRRMFDLPSR